MALPPKGDPRRPLHFAIRSTRVLCALFLLTGSCGMMRLLRGGNPLSDLGGAVAATAGTLFYLGPGALYLVFSIYLARRQFWAVVGAIVLASVQLLVVIASGGIALIFLLNPHVGLEPVMAIPTLLILFVALALAQLIYHLSKSFEAIKHPPYGQEFHGFEPIIGNATVAPPQGSDSFRGK